MGATTTYTQSVVPAGLTATADDINARQLAISSKPYSAYPGERIADFNANQNAGFDVTKNATTGYQSGFDRATGAVDKALGRSTADAISPMLKGITDTSGQQPATDLLSLAQKYTEAGADPIALKMAQPFLDKASGSAVDNIDKFMNPYIDKVIGHFSDTQQRNLQENLIPAATNKFIGAGQLGGGPARGGGGGAPSGLRTDTARALRDTTDSVNKYASDMMMGGWNSALTASNADLTRFGNLAGVAGDIGNSTAQGYSRAGAGLADVGGRLSAIDFGNRGLQKDAASIYGTAYAGDTSNQLTGASTLADITNNRSNLDFKSGAALVGIGNQQQALAQAHDDVNYSDYKDRAGYDQAMVDKRAETLNKTAPFYPSGQTSYSNTKTPSASALQTALGLGATALGASMR